MDLPHIASNSMILFTLQRKHESLKSLVQKGFPGLNDSSNILLEKGSDSEPPGEKLLTQL
jgi:hypothetical protein